MSLAQKAARGALWTVISSMGGRAVGVLGTLIMTRFLAPEEIGEVGVALVVVMSANWITIWGFGQYAVVKGRGPDAAEVTWHATFFYLSLGTISLGLMAVFGDRLMPYFNASDAVDYIPWLALAFFIRRMSAMPERVLTRQMNFRPSGMALMLGEITYTVSAIALAMLDYGAMAIIYANVIQSCAVFAVLVRAAGVRSWATPTPLRLERIKDMLRYGVPLGIQGIIAQAARYWDRPTIAYFLGTPAAGAYNMAYNLADIPATQVGEQIALVLMPSMAELPPERRGAALERSTALLSLIIFPLAVGLGLVAYPLIGLILPKEQVVGQIDWQDVAPLLTVLACLSVFRPITWVLSAYMEAESKTNKLMVLELAKLGLLIGGLWVLHPYGIRTATFAIGIAFGVTAIAGVLMVSREGPSPWRLLDGFLRPLLACGVMAVASLGVRQVLIMVGLDHNAIVLAAMIVVGAGAYVAAALVISRETSRDLLSLVKRALKRS
jgi:lipopolysaccharide exporter